MSAPRRRHAADITWSISFPLYESLNVQTAPGDRYSRYSTVLSSDACVKYANSHTRDDHTFTVIDERPIADHQRALDALEAEPSRVRRCDHLSLHSYSPFSFFISILPLFRHFSFSFCLSRSPTLPPSISVLSLSVFSSRISSPAPLMLIPPSESASQGLNQPCETGLREVPVVGLLTRAA